MAKVLFSLLLLLAPLSADAADWMTVQGSGVRAEGPRSHHWLVLDLHYVAAQEWPALAAELGLLRPRPVTVVLVPSAGDHSRASWIEQEAPAWAIGYAPLDTPFAAVFARRWPDAIDGAPPLMAETLVHELAHVAIYQRGGATASKWWQEGVAAWLSLRWRGWDGPYIDSAETAGLAPLAAIKTQQQWWATHEDGTGALIYRAAADFARWASEEHGDDIAARVLARLGSEPFHAAWRSETGEGVATSEARWRESLHDGSPVIADSSVVIAD